MNFFIVVVHQFDQFIKEHPSCITVGQNAILHFCLYPEYTETGGKRLRVTVIVIQFLIACESVILQHIIIGKEFR